MDTTHSSNVKCLGHLNHKAFRIVLFIAFAQFISTSFIACNTPGSNKYAIQT